MSRKLKNIKPHVWLQQLPQKAGGVSRPSQKYVLHYAVYVEEKQFLNYDKPNPNANPQIDSKNKRVLTLTLKDPDSIAPEHWITGTFEVKVSELINGEEGINFIVTTGGGPGESGSTVTRYDDADDD